MPSEMGKRMLIIVAKRGYTGASREVFFHHIRGIRYADLEKEVLGLEREELITIEWVGPSNFTVNITSKGVDVAKSYQEDVWRKSTEALEKVHSTKHVEKSVVDDDADYSKIIDDKMHVKEVGSVADEIIKQLDKQILAERAEASTDDVEEAMPVAVGIPASREIGDSENIAYDKDVVERRISGEIEQEVREDATLIQLEAGVDQVEARIGKEAATLETKVKEKRISGESDPRSVAGAQGKGKPPRPPKGKTGKAVPPAPKSFLEESAYEYEEETAPAETEEVMEAPVLTEAPEIPEAEDTAEEPVDTLPGFTLEELLADDDEVPSEAEAEAEAPLEPVSVKCLWESEKDCPILKAKEMGSGTELTPDQCMVCQLVQIKHLLKRR